MEKGEEQRQLLVQCKIHEPSVQGEYIAELRKSDLKIPQKVYNEVFRKKWVVIAKQPFRSPKYVIEYLQTQYSALAYRRAKFLVIVPSYYNRYIVFVYP
jgi:hypothetical protein